MAESRLPELPTNQPDRSPGLGVWALAVVVSFSTAAAAINVSVAILLRRTGLETAPRLAAALAVALLWVLALQIPCWLLAWPFLKRYQASRGTLAATVGSFFLTLAFLQPTADLVVNSAAYSESAPATRLVLTSTIWAPILLLPCLVLLVAVRGDPSHGFRRLARTLLIALPWLALEVLGISWMEIYRVQGIGSKQSLMYLALFGLTAGMTVVVVWRLSASRQLVIPVVTPAVALLAWPTLLLLAARPESALSDPGDSSSTCAVLLTVDTLRTDALSIYNSDALRTPAIDSLGSDSVVFSQAYSPASWTKPAMASMMTGLSPSTHGAIHVDSRLPDVATTLAEQLSSAGFVTAGIGKNGFLRENFGFGQGFGEYYFFPRSNGGTFGSWLLTKLLPLRYANQASTEELTAYAVDWLKSYKDTKFFLWLHFFDPHVPYEPPTDLLGTLEAPAGYGNSFSSWEAIRRGNMVPTLRQREWIRHLYLAEVLNVDRNIGKLLDAMKSLGLYDRCLIAFTSDHGEEFWEHGGFEHGHSMYEEVLRVPLFLKLPQTGARGQVTTRVSTEQIMPTMLELLEVENRFGSSTSAPLLDESDTRKDADWRSLPSPQLSLPIFSRGTLYFAQKEAVIFDDVKYIRETVTGEEELFLLSADPREAHSVKTEHGELLRQARSLLDTHSSRSSELREKLGLSGEEADPLDEELLEELRSLGYIH